MTAYHRAGILAFAFAAWAILARARLADWRRGVTSYPAAVAGLVVDGIILGGIAWLVAGGAD